jgi:hypothetical protein
MVDAVPSGLAQVEPVLLPELTAALTVLEGALVDGSSVEGSSVEDVPAAPVEFAAPVEPAAPSELLACLGATQNQPFS